MVEHHLKEARNIVCCGKNAASRMCLSSRIRGIEPLSRAAGVERPAHVDHAREEVIGRRQPGVVQTGGCKDVLVHERRKWFLADFLDDQSQHSIPDVAVFDFAAGRRNGAGMNICAQFIGCAGVWR